MGLFLPFNKSLPEVSEIIELLNDIIGDNTTKAKDNAERVDETRSVKQDVSLMDDSTILEKTTIIKEDPMF